MECEQVVKGSKCPACETNMVRITTEVIAPDRNPSAVIGEACIQETLTIDLCTTCGATHEVFKSDNFDMVKVTLAMFYYNIELLNKKAQKEGK